MPRRQVRGQRPPGATSRQRWIPRDARDRLPVLGVDIGGVIVDRAAEGSDTSFFGFRPRDTPVVDGAIDALRVLTEGVFEWRVHLVSKAGATTAATTRQWLEHIRFFDRTGVGRGNLHFVDDRRDKGPVCERLGVTHFVDDRVPVLELLPTVPNRFLFIGGLGQKKPPQSVPPGIGVSSSWWDLRHRIEATV